jgi:uncharacterized membrane protein YhaH (DUF805 family)
MQTTGFQDLFFSTHGRIARREFWAGSLMLMALSGVLTYVLYGQDVAWPGIFSIVGMLLVWPTWCVNIKRMHDRGKSGIWAIFYFIPFVGYIWWIFDLWLLAGSDGPNMFGEDPEAPAIEAISQ